jgi:hypothetical protein
MGAVENAVRLLSLSTRRMAPFLESLACSSRYGTGALTVFLFCRVTQARPEDARGLAPVAEEKVVVLDDPPARLQPQRPLPPLQVTTHAPPPPMPVASGGGVDPPAYQPVIMQAPQQVGNSEIPICSDSHFLLNKQKEESRLNWLASTKFPV